VGGIYESNLSPIPPNPHRYRSFFVDSFKKIGDIERLDIGDYVAAATADNEKRMKTTTPAVFTSEPSSVTDPWMIFLYALKAAATRDKYIQRLTKFLDFLGYTGTREDKARAFAAQARAEPNYAFNSVLKFFQSKREQIDRKEIAIGTVRNYVKSIKLFCDMADVQVPWAKITRGLPRAKRFADDRAPTLQEIRKIVEYPDRRIKPAVYMILK
jgi:hypothetical protein